MPFELVEIILAGQIVAVDPLSGEKHDKDSDNCFFCKREMKHYSLCDARKAYLAWNNVEGSCINKMRAEYRNRRLDELKFRVIDVEEYEQKHNLIKKQAMNSRDKFVAPQRKEVTAWSSTSAWISGKEIMERFGWLPVELAIVSFMFDVAVTCPRRGTILDIYTRIVTALWYKENETALNLYEEDSCSLKLYMQELLEKTKIDDLSLDNSNVFFDFWFDNCESFLFSKEGVYKAEKVYIDSGLREPFLTKNEHGNLLQTPQDIPDNPLDYGKQLVSKGYQPQVRISRMKEAFPWLTTAEIGAYARGIEPGEVSKSANKKWYQDNKPR